ncbi:MAG: hypothetical protein HY074_09660 [Deltaproteobacteria bacterium]|nr:hypothetical protein [Deltaproteobacteria bacterium]
MSKGFPEVAIKTWARGCAGKVPAACSELGVILQRTGELDRALQAYATACALRSTCFSPPKYQPACSDGAGTGCYKIEQIIPTLKNPAEQFKYAVGACRAGHHANCLLADAAVKRLGEPERAQLAAAYAGLKDDCAKGDYVACKLTAKHANESGNKGMKEKFCEEWRKASKVHCDDGNEEACKYLKSGNATGVCIL